MIRNKKGLHARASARFVTCAERFSAQVRVSRDGQVVTDARYFVKTRGSSALRLGLPAGAGLWETKVDGAPVNARQDGREILVPLPAKGSTTRSPGSEWTRTMRSRIFSGFCVG